MPRTEVMLAATFAFEGDISSENKVSFNIRNEFEKWIISKYPTLDNLRVDTQVKIPLVNTPGWKEALDYVISGDAFGPAIYKSPKDLVDYVRHNYFCGTLLQALRRDRYNIIAPIMMQRLRNLVRLELDKEFSGINRELDKTLAAIVIISNALPNGMYVGMTEKIWEVIEPLLPRCPYLSKYKS